MGSRGLFISLEGGEGSGKTTQAERLLRRLREAGEKAASVKEPGSTPLGDRLRELLKGNLPMSPTTELLLFVAARAELVSAVLWPTLERGIHVIADRYADSTLAYQGYGHRMSLVTIEGLNGIATGGLKPDVTFLLALPAQQGLKRTRSQASLGSAMAGEGRESEEGLERFEQRSLAFHQRVLDGYRRLAAQEPERWCVLDATRPVDEVSAAVWKRVQPELRRVRRLARRRSALPVAEQARPRLL
ncbi:MAG: dTMP kinase [Dehalococcoidia bacterium]|nr:dTMP kinase [Dehalococcoidia bacterium]